MAYKGMMLSGVPNSAFTVGYTNSSWTLKARPGLQRVCRSGVSGAFDTTHFLAVLEELPMANMEPVPHLQGTALGAAPPPPAFEIAAPTAAATSTAATVAVPRAGEALAGETSVAP